MFEAAILAYKQIVRIFEMPPIQFLICKVKASRLPNSKSLPRLVQFLDVYAGLYRFSKIDLECSS